MMQMVKTMFQGFKVLIDLEVEGKIVKTNADYVNGSRVTLLEIDMATLFEDEAALTALQSKVGPGASIADVRALSEGREGREDQQPGRDDRVPIGVSLRRPPRVSRRSAAPWPDFARRCWWRSH